MNQQTVVIALGGNALGNSSTEQKDAVKIVAKVVVDMKEQGHNLVICHGNGPQVGAINNAFDIASKESQGIEAMPFAECGAMSQGYIGFHLQNAIQNEAKNRNLDLMPLAIVTQTLVDKNDSAFKNPTKPVGRFMSESEAKEIASANDWKVIEDSGRGWRRVVPSPLPIQIVESKQIETLLAAGTIVIAGGGGGIPVFEENNKLIGIDAVIDKDNTASKLAEDINANTFIILTAEDKIIINYGKPNQKPLDEVTTSELEKLSAENHFPPGSMGPKVNAVVKFTKSTGNPSFVADLRFASQVLTREHGTKIIKD